MLFRSTFPSAKLSSAINSIISWNAAKETSVALITHIGPLWKLHTFQAILSCLCNPFSATLHKIVQHYNKSNNTHGSIIILTALKAEKSDRILWMYRAPPCQHPDHMVALTECTISERYNFLSSNIVNLYDIWAVFWSSDVNNISIWLNNKSLYNTLR